MKFLHTSHGRRTDQIFLMMIRIEAMVRVQFVVTSFDELKYI